jgi:hypothetical protein
LVVDSLEVVSRSDSNGTVKLLWRQLVLLLMLVLLLS